MLNIDNALEIGIETLTIVGSQAQILAISQTYEDEVYILQEMKKELNNGIKQIDELIGD